MKNQSFIRINSLLIILVILGLFFSCSKEDIEQEEKTVLNLQSNKTDKIEGHYIIIASKNPAVKNARAATALEALSKEVGQMPKARVNRMYRNVFSGFAAELTDKQVEKLRKDPRVQSIEQDRYIYLDNTPVVQENANWGLDRIDQREKLLNHTYAYSATGKGVTAYIIDTGIRDSHEEFGERATLGYDFSTEDPENDDPDMEPGEDCYGHGTPVAGIIGGSQYGVAKDINLISVKVFSCKGGAVASTAIAAIDWVTDNAVGPSIVNASFGYTESEALDLAVKNSIATGIHYAISAGNENYDACQKSPARVPGAITVGATDIMNEMAYFSNYGDCVDIFGPGLNTVSASQLDDTSSRQFSGTSAAAPYVAGVMALYLENNPDATPAELHTALIQNSTQNAVSNVPSGNNNMVFSLWDPVEFDSPVPELIVLEAVTYKERGRQMIDLSWNVTNAGYVDFYKDGRLIIPELYNDGEQTITGTNGNDGVYTFQVCETGYNNCSEVLTVIFGDGDGSGGDITNEPPTANFTYSADLLKVQFSNSSTDSDGSITTWNWNFGDGNLSSAKDPVHTFSEAGTYEVSLSVTDDFGDSDNISKSVIVSTNEPEPEGINLSANGFKVKGAWNADLSWDASGLMDIYRNGVLIATVTNINGPYKDVTEFRGSGSLDYKICEAGSTVNCSNEVTVQF